jgi:hypothetical protein
MTVPAITERDILDVVGDVDPLTVARILAIAPSRDELEAAAASEQDEQAFGEESRPATTERIEEVREILAELAAAETDDAEPAS